MSSMYNSFFVACSMQIFWLHHKVLGLFHCVSLILLLVVFWRAEGRGWKVWCGIYAMWLHIFSVCYSIKIYRDKTDIMTCMRLMAHCYCRCRFCHRTASCSSWYECVCTIINFHFQLFKSISTTYTMSKCTCLVYVCTVQQQRST